MAEQVNTRELVLQILIGINENGQYSHIILRQVLDKYQYLSHQDRAFITRLTEGTMERLIEMDWRIDSVSRTKVRKMKPLIRNLLRMSVYQLCYMDSVPDSAVCNEAVKLAKRHGFGQLSGFVNGVLRNLARTRETVVWPDEKKDLFRSLEVRFSLPRWILELWARDYGMEKTLRMAQALGKTWPLTIRTNILHQTPEELRAKLEAEGVQVEAAGDLPYAFSITGFDYLGSLACFQAGDFYVQDLSSMMVAEAASPRTGDYIIDVCAAPGGKSTHLAEKLGGSGMVEARDLTDSKVALIRENIARHGLTNMKAVCRDARQPDPDSLEKADILICDLPCSGLGVMGHKTDIRYRQSPGQLKELAALQRQILDNVCSFVKPGGTLIYSTCTVDRQENQDNIAWFLSGHPGFALVSEQQFFPGDPGQDGFYLAKMIRQEGKER